MTNQALATSLVLVAALAACSIWVLLDARARQRRGRPVEAYLGQLSLVSPETWAIGCLVLVVIFFPLYCVARSQS